jgi:TrmH family RNA methyltransferase
MITKAQVKHIRSLDDKKNRLEHREFVVEGDKMVTELLQSKLHVIHLFAIKKWIEANKYILPAMADIHEVEESELGRISHMTTPNQVLAVASLPKNNAIEPMGVSLVLDTIQDPGNMGSIIRIADWFGVSSIFCSMQCVDVYNPKVIQSSMGSLFRVGIYYCDILQLLQSHQHIEAYAAALAGDPIREVVLKKDAFIVIGNESKGISADVMHACHHRMTIPRKGEAESLNAAVATGIICHSLLS